MFGLETSNGSRSFPERVSHTKGKPIMWDNTLQARWRGLFGFNPSKEHLSAIYKKLGRDLNIEHHIATKLTDDDLVAILKQVAKEAKEKKDKEEKDQKPPETGGTQPPPAGGK